MVYENNFRVLHDSMIVDPALKVFVQMGLLHWEGEGRQTLHISHDPDMRPAILTRIADQDLAEKLGDEQKMSQLNALEFSDKKFTFFEFTIKKITEGETLVFEFLGPDDVYRHANLGSEVRKNLYKCPDHKAFLLYVFRNLLLIPKLQKWGFGKCTKAQLRMSAVKFALLEGRPTEGVSGNVILSECDLEGEV
jgi:hypothetical protein